MKNIKFYLLSFFIILLISGCSDNGASNNPPPSSWDIVIVDSDGNVGEYSSIAVDSDSKAHIAYFDHIGYELIGTDTIPRGNLKYATNADGVWETAILDTGTGMTPRIFVDNNDKIHIVHTKLGATNLPDILNLRYTTNVSGFWETITISPEVVKGSDASIIVDSNGKVHISYRNEEGVGTTSEGSDGGLRYVTNATGEWTWVQVDPCSIAGNDTDIALDGNDKVHISYLDKGAGLKYATNVTGSWEFYIIDGTYNVGWNTSIAVDSDNNVHISYSDPAPLIDPPGNGYLKYATDVSGAWTIQVLDDDEAGYYTGIAVDGDDNIHIAYHTLDGIAGDLDYATDASGSWELEEVDGEGIVGLFCAIALDPDGKPHFSYYDYENQILKYAKRE